jgi:acetyl esterase/lipase
MKFSSLFIICLVIALAACILLAKKEKLKIEPDEKIPFKKTEKEDLLLHMFYPKGFDKKNPLPCIVFFFGGGWNGGSPSQFYPQSRYLADRGMVAISAQYRTKKSHKVQPFVCVEDGRSAIRYVREHAKELGVVPDRVAAGGGSAGGHVAAATATVTKFDSKRDNLKISAIPDALVLFNPVYDNGPKGYGYDRVKDYYKDISPRHNIHARMPPCIVFLGDKDKHLPVKSAEEFKNEMIQKGVRSELFVYEGQSHGFFNLHKGGKDVFCETVTEMDRFLTSLEFFKGRPDCSGWLDKMMKK